MKKLLTISLTLLSIVSIGCEASSHKNHSGIQSSVSDRKSNATYLNLMLDEVLKPVLLTLQVNVRMLVILSPNTFIQEWIRKKLAI